MARLFKIRQLIKALRPLGDNLRVAALVLTMALSTIGLTFQPCQCPSSACGQVTEACCCSSGTPSSCNCCCCDNSAGGCSCVFCMCSIEVEVEPTSLPRINDSVTPMVFTTTISLIFQKTFLPALFRTDRTAVTTQTHLYALHCRWLI